MNKKEGGISMERIISSNNNNNSSRRISMKEFSNNNGGDFLAGFSWPPRSYTCTFCRREFRSAQALGGHMNVHRRDRARLRHSPPPPPPPPPPLEGHYPTTITSSSSSSCPLLLNLNLDPINTTPTNPNPNPNPNPSFSTTLLTLPPTRRLPSFIPSFVPSSSGDEAVAAGRWSTVDGVPVNRRRHVVATNYRVKGHKRELEVVMMKKGEIGKVDLKIGFKEDLDLELRLGYT